MTLFLLSLFFSVSLLGLRDPLIETAIFKTFCLLHCSVRKQLLSFGMSYVET